MDKFKQMGLGGKIITISGAVAIFSLFLNWVDMGIISASGFQQQGYFFLVFYIYPVWCTFKNKDIKRVFGIISSALAIISSFAFVSSKSVDLFGETINVASTGLYLFLIASIALLVGVIKYSPVNDIIE